MTPFSLYSHVSGHAIAIDHFFFALTALSVLVSALVFGLIAALSVRYRAGGPHAGGARPGIELEITWTVATFFLFLFIFWWAASSELQALHAPSNTLDIHVVAKQWMWKAQQPNGIREINEIHAPIDTPVRLIMTSEDVIHSMFLPALRIKQDVLPDRYTYLWFTAKKAGVYHLLCTQFCGTEHSRMTGRLVLMAPQDYARWTAMRPQSQSLAAQGESLFRSLGCSGCHGPNSSVHAPDLAGVYVRAVHLSDGRTITADDAYIRDSILLPNKDIVAGFEPVMPSFAKIVSEDQTEMLIAYIKSLQTAGPGLDAEGERK
jgi:cytochrome c oxidase subunit II